MNSEHLNTVASDLSKQSLDVLRKVVYETPFHYFHMERCRLIEDPPTMWDIARMGNRWIHHDSFLDKGRRVDIWINWDNRVKFECKGKVILRMWCPAGEILQGIEDRKRANC